MNVTLGVAYFTPNCLRIRYISTIEAMVANKDLSVSESKSTMACKAQGSSTNRYEKGIKEKGIQFHLSIMRIFIGIVLEYDVY